MENKTGIFACIYYITYLSKRRRRCSRHVKIENIQPTVMTAADVQATVTPIMLFAESRWRHSVTNWIWLEQTSDDVKIKRFLRPVFLLESSQSKV